MDINFITKLKELSPKVQETLGIKDPFTSEGIYLDLREGSCGLYKKYESETRLLYFSAKRSQKKLDAVLKIVIEFGNVEINYSL